MKKQQRCYIYTRVSTSMQVDGYSLDAQKDKLHKYADYQDMIIAREYSDEGKSGKSVEGRPQFQQMLQDIESGKDNIDFVLVFKLSRFGRNAADVLSSLQRMQDFGVNLICVEDGIDSSKDAGKLMISVLSAVAEIERENILVQTMEGRRQKAREGKWNGGFAPYGYQLINGELHIAEDEAEVIRIIYDKFANTTMGIAAIAAFLNNSGYKKKLRQNNTIEGFSTSFVKGVLDNPVYCGKLAFGRRKNEKIPGTRNEYHIVKQDKYMLNDGIHEAIVSEELWNQVHKKRQETGVVNIKSHSLDHEHILSGIIKCPICGSGMYGNVNRKKHPDGGHYKDYFYYACKHRTFVNGHKCTYRKQWSEDKINAAVEEVIRKLVNNPKFKTEIQKHIGQSIDTQELDREHTGLLERLKQVTGAKNKLANQMDNLSVSDKHYDKKYEDMQVRLDKLYDEIEEIETLIEEVETRLYNIRQEKISANNVYQFLLFFDKLYDRFTDIEKKTFMKSFLADVNIYEEEQADGRILRSLKFRFPVFFNGKEIYELDWDNETTVETVVCLSRKNSKDKKQAFFENTKLLSDKLGITPLMYGSLGLEYLTGENLNADDIDILIPKAFITERWTEFKSVLESNGYTLIDEHEHEFEKDGVHYSYAQIEELESFADIGLSEIAAFSKEGATYKLLSLPQYLKVYTVSSKDGYRTNVREKKDFDKIAFIQKKLQEETNKIFPPKRITDETVACLQRVNV